jgi:HEPN domain
MKIPGNVQSIIVHKNGRKEYIYFPFPVVDHWSEALVNSSSFKMLDPGEKLYRQAIAFLHAGRSLCQVAGRKGKKLGWSEASVCWYCLNIAIELFLKACICQSEGNIEKTHDISHLLSRYRQILPKRQFQFRTQWDLSLKEIEKTFKVHIGNPVDHTPDQLHRYGIDVEGKGSAGIQFFSANVFFGYVNHLDEVWRRAWNTICED